MGYRLLAHRPDHSYSAASLRSVRGGLALSAYAWTHGRSLDWGAGGPERWPSARPYLTPAGSQDQRGFRIFDWYRAVTQATIGADLPMLLARKRFAGQPDGGHGQR